MDLLNLSGFSFDPLMVHASTVLVLAALLLAVASVFVVTGRDTTDTTH